MQREPEGLAVEPLCQYDGVGHAFGEELLDQWKRANTLG